MKLGVLGSGNMGRAIGVRLAQLGHQVLFGARRAEQAQYAASLAGAGSTAGSIAEAAVFGQVLLWTMRETDPTRVLNDPAALNGKIILDPNNRDYDDAVAVGEFPGRSLGELLQDTLNGARVVKAFTTIPMEMFDCEPDELRQIDAQTFIAGNDLSAKETVAALTLQLGFRSIDMGNGPIAFRAVEALGDCVRHLMAGRYGLHAHLRLDRLPQPRLEAVGSRVWGSYR